MNITSKTALAEGFCVAYTSGSSKGNPGPSGAAFVLYSPDGSRSEGKRKSPDSTNNYAELAAVIDALEATPEGSRVLVCLTSGYVKSNSEEQLPKWSENGFRTTTGKPVKNQDLWTRLHSLMSKRDVSFYKVNARSVDPDNDAVVAMAQEEAMRASKRAYG